MSVRAPAADQPIAMVVAVGDELLYGQTVDANGSWLSEQLSGLGFDVTQRWVVGDEEEQIRSAVDSALNEADAVIVTGGLGPTPDDLTRPVVTDLFQLESYTSEELLHRLEDRFRARGYDRLPEGAESMAEVPVGARVLPNPVGAAPGLVLGTPRDGLCVLLPGVPREMKALFAEEVTPLLSARFSAGLRPVHHRIIPTFGVPESVLSEELARVLPEDLDGVTLAFLPDEISVRLRLSARDRAMGPSAAERMDAVESRLEPVLGRYRFDATSLDLAEAVGTALRESGQTLAVAESCTGGLIAKRLTDIPGSSSVFGGGVVAYANEVKETLLGVPEEIMVSDGVVSESVALAMARGAAKILGATMGVGVTGIAGPDGGSDEKPVGTVCYAAVGFGRSEVRTELLLGDRQAIRARAAQAVLGLVLRMIRAGEV